MAASFQACLEYFRHLTRMPPRKQKTVRPQKNRQHKGKNKASTCPTSATTSASVSRGKTKPYKNSQKKEVKARNTVKPSNMRGFDVCSVPAKQASKWGNMRHSTIALCESILKHHSVGLLVENSRSFQRDSQVLKAFQNKVIAKLGNTLAPQTKIDYEHLDGLVKETQAYVQHLEEKQEFLEETLAREKRKIEKLKQKRKETGKKNKKNSRKSTSICKT